MLRNAQLKDQELAEASMRFCGKALSFKHLGPHDGSKKRPLQDFAYHVPQSWLLSTLSMKVYSFPGQTTRLMRRSYTATTMRHRRSPLKVRAGSDVLNPAVRCS